MEGGGPENSGKSGASENHGKTADKGKRWPMRGWIHKGHLVDSCDKLIQDLNNELNWLSDTEQLLRDDQPISDEAYKVKSQLEAQRAFHSDIQKHQQPILALVYQTEQLLEHHQEELTPEQVAQLQQLAENLKSNMSKVQKTSEIRLKHLTTACDEVTKFEEELTKFDEWLEQSSKELNREEELIRDLDNFNRVMEQQKELMNDIISHQADTRFMTMSVQKYMEEAKLHKLEVDAFKANRKKTSRLSWIGMEGMDAEMVGNKLKAEVAKYDELSSQCADFGEKLGNLNTKQREFNDNTFKLLSWLTATEEKLSTSKQESNTTDPDILREQLDLMKSLGSDALSQGVHLEELEKLEKELVSDLHNLSVVPAHITKFQEIIQDIEDRHREVTKEINDRSNSLQTALTKSQDVEDALDNLLMWLRDTESALDNQRPVSLSRDNLNEQYQEIKLIQSDIVSHKPSIEAMKHDAHELIKTCELDMAKSLESKLEDLDDKFSNVNKKCQNRNKDMDEISETLSNFQETMDNCKQWLSRHSEELESREWSKKSSEDTKEKIEDLNKQRESKEKVVEELTQLGQLLIEDPRTGEVSAVKESLADLQRHWTDFLEILEERQQETQEKEKQRNEYSDSKKAIVEWLTKMENTVDGFEPVAVDIEVAERQIEELEPLLEEYQEYGPILEDVNDAGFAFDATQSEGSRPQSPFRRMMRGRRYQGLLSPRLGSTSPTFPYPTSPTNILSPSSDSSGISSKKSSFDNFQLDDLSEIQQELVDINQRYDILGERLADRHQELRNIVESMKSYLQNMQELLTWIDLKELDLNIQGGLPTSEREAKKQLKEHQEFHAELLGKENLVSDIRSKGQELLKTKQGVPGLEVCHQQLSELDNKWLDIKVLSEQRRKSLEEMVKNISAFKDAGVHLQKWIAQKEKMMAVLGPISTEKEMNQNQVEQVKLLTEEFKGQAPLYEKFIQSGHTILDLCEADSKDASHISEKMDVISKDWSRLESRLQERGKALKSVEGLSLEFNDIMKTVQDWVDDFSDRVGSITPGMLSPEENEAYLKELQALDSELNNQKLLAQKTKDLHKKLCEVTKDPSTKMELKQRIASLEKQLSDAEKQIGAKRAAVAKASSEGQELTARCHDTLDWLADIRSRQDQQQPVSGNLDILKQQAEQQRILHKDLVDHEPEIKDLLQKCESLLQSVPACKETQDLEDTAEEIRAEFEELKLCALEHDQKLEASIKHAQCFQDMLDKQLLWLQFSQDKLEGFQTTELQRDIIAKKLSDAQSLKAEVRDHAPELRKLQTEGETLADLVEQDGDIARDAIHMVSEKWQELDQGVTDRVRSLEDLMQKLDDFKYNMKDYSSNLARCEDSMTSHSKLGPSAKDPRHADKIKALQDDVDGLQPQMDYLEAVIEDLSHTGLGTRDLERDLENQKQKQENLQSDIAHLLTELDEGNQVVGEFQDEVSSLSTSLSGLESDLSSIGPVKRDEHGLQIQLRGAEEFLSNLNSLEDRITGAEEKGKNLESSGFITDPQLVEAPIDALKTQFRNLKSKAESCKKDIEDMQDFLDRVTDDLRRTKTSIDRASDELDMHEPVGTDVAAIKRQQDELQMFEGSVLEPLQKRVEDGSSKAANLIQTAAPSVNTEQLEQELESLNDKWTDLKKKVSERKHNLENNLLQAGKFHDALDQLLVWLKDTEETIANQKSPSPDYKICKTQLQEQKFLMTMLEDRSPSVKSAKNSAESLMRGLNPQEQKGVQNQVAQLEHRWEAVCSTSRDRLDMLEEMLGLSKDFQDLHEPLTAWLELTEKKFASLEPSAMDTEGIENIVISLKDMEREIQTKADEVKDLALRGKDLQDFCKGNDVKAVQKKIDSVQARFTELREKVLDSTEQMEEALPLAKNFNEAHADFLDWVFKTESQLRTKEATGQEAEEQVQKFMEKLQEIQPVLEVLREDGGSLADLAPGDAGLKVEETMRKDLQRYDTVSDQIQRRSQKVSRSKQRSSEIVGNITDLLDWFDDKEKILTNFPPISTELDTLDKQLTDVKELNEEITEQKGNARDIITRGKKMMRESSLEHDPRLRDAVEELKNKSDLVWKMGQERQRTLEQAFPLAKHFWETNKDLSDWLAEAAVIVADLKVLSIDTEQVKKQQEKVKVLKQEVQDHKPDIDRLNKTGSALIKMCGEREISQVQKIMDDQNSKIEDIKNYLKDRSLSIDEALQQSAEFTDKLEDILETLTSTHEMVENAEPISAHADKIKDQLAEVKAFMEDVDSRQAALASIKNKAEELIKQAGDKEDTAVQDVKTKLSELIGLYDNICQLSTARSKDLEDTLEVSEKFWEDYNNLCTTVKDLQDHITSQEPPALEPAIIREQQDLLETLKEEIEATQVDLDDFSMTGEQLMTMVGEPERPEVQKNMEDVSSQVGMVTEKYEQRARTLEAALEKAVHFQDELMKILVWLQKREVRLREFTPVGSDFDTIKVQWNQVKELKSEVEPKQVDIESLNQKGQEMAKDAQSADQMVVKEPLSSVNRRWDNLLEGIGERQRNLQMAMLNIGQFEHALNELLAWLDKTDETLDDMSSSYGEPKQIEIELAKLKIIQNDVDAHRDSVDSVKEAGKRVLATEHGGDTAIKRKLSDVDELWEKVQKKSASKFKQMKDALREAKSFTGELQDLLLHISDLEGNLISSNQIGGLPETAKEQLERFMNLYEELNETDPKVKKTVADGESLISKSKDASSNHIKQNMELLQNRWQNIQMRAADKKKKLEDALQQADNFHADLNSFIQWLTETEKTLNNLEPVSRLLEHVTQQIEDQKILQKDISHNREKMIALDKTGTHLKYFSQKQDVILIRNLLSSIQHRWEKIVSRSAERTRHLERGYKEAKQFFVMWKDMMEWMQQAETVLDSDTSVSNDHATIKAQIAKHREFQRSLGAKQPIYDSVNRMGRSMKDKSPEPDRPQIEKRLGTMKGKWNSLCAKSVDRQRKLEEALLFAGQFSEALQALLDWLAKVEPTLGEDQPVYGDIFTVNNLMEIHKAFQHELGARSNTVAFVRKRAKEMLDKSEHDTTQQQAELIELTTMWDRVCKLSVNKQEKLEQAHKLAEDFHQKGQALLDWLASAERQLRYRGALPEEELPLLKQIEEHKKFEEDLMRQEAKLRETLSIGQDILKRCHPDALTTLKHWLSVLRARWEEVTAMCKQRGIKLAEGLQTMRRNNAILDDLLAWLNGAEATLMGLDQEPIPGDIQVIMDLLKDHQDFQNDMSSKQPDVDRLTKGDRRRGTSVSEPVSQIPVLKASPSGRHTPIRTPRKDPSGRKTPEPVFRNPRVGALFMKWRTVWLMALDRHRKLKDALDYLKEVERLKDFKFDDWRRRYLQYMRHNKSRIMDMFRRQDQDRDGRVTRKEFIDGITATKFPTSQLEMETVANMFDRDGSGLIDYKDFVNALKPDREPQKPITDAEKITDEVKNQVSKCTCVKQFKIHKIGEGKYRFGDSQKLRLVRILRSTVMVRVGGGWVALDEFLVKNDPCRAKGRTNVELREQFILAQGVSQSMSPFVSKSPSGSSHSGSSSYSGASWSTRSPSSATGPITKVREKTVHSTPWRQNGGRLTPGPDGEVRQIMSHTGVDSTPKRPRHIASPRNVFSPAVPGSGRSSRASTGGGSRPPSRADSECSEVSEPEMYTTVQHETKSAGGRKQTVVTYQTHVVKTKTAGTPSSAKVSKIPKPSSTRKK